MITNQFLKHRLTDQTGVVNYNFLISLDNIVGSCNIGFSGDNLFLFNFNNGKIFDPYSRFIGTYYSNQLNNLSGNINSTRNDFYLNNDLIYSNTPKASGKISYLILDPSGCSLNFDAKIYGSVPNITSTVSSFYFQSGNILTGTVINTNPATAFSILSGDIPVASDFILSGLPIYNITGQSKFYLVATDSLRGSNYNLPIRFYTDFGTLDISAAISGLEGDFETTIINIFPNRFYLANGENALYNVYVYNSNGVTLDVSLTYVSGKTGDIFDASGISKTITGRVSGFISGFGQITGQGTGLISGFDAHFNNWSTGTGYGTLTKDQYATGNFLVNYTVELTGLGSGTFVLSNIEGQGFGETTLSGFVPITGGNISGIIYNLYGTGNVSVAAAQALGLSTNAAFQVEGVMPVASGEGFVPFTGTITYIFNEDSYTSIPFSEVLAATGEFEKPYSLIGTGFVTTNTGVHGYVDFDFVTKARYGSYIFTKPISGIVYGQSSGIQSIYTCSPTGVPVSGLITGVSSVSGDIFYCPATGAFNFKIPYTGTIVKFYRDCEIDPSEYIFIRPTNTNIRESAANTINGLTTRTRASRYITSVSGSGDFLEIFNKCYYSGNFTGIFDNTGGLEQVFVPVDPYWTEYIASTYSEVQCNPTGMRLSSVVASANVVKCFGNFSAYFDVLENQTPISILISTTTNTTGILKIISGQTEIYNSPTYQTNTGAFILNLDSGTYNVLFSGSGCGAGLGIKYSCVNSICTVDENGVYNSFAECQNNCTPPPPPSAVTGWSCVITGTQVYYNLFMFPNSLFNGEYFAFYSGDNKLRYVKRGDNQIVTLLMFRDVSGYDNGYNQKTGWHLHEWDGISEGQGKMFYYSPYTGTNASYASWFTDYLQGNPVSSYVISGTDDSYGCIEILSGTYPSQGVCSSHCTITTRYYRIGA